MTTLKKTHKLDLVDIDGIPFLTEISNRSAESIRGGFSFASRDINNIVLSSGTTDEGLRMPSRREVDPRTHTLQLRSQELGGGFLIAIPEQNPILIYPRTDSTFVTVERDILALVPEGVRILITDVGRLPNSGTCSSTDTFGCPRPDPSGTGSRSRSSLAFFPSS